MKREAVVFRDLPSTPTAMVAAGRALLGIRYATHRNYIARNADGSIDFARSSLNCYGFLLAVARALGWLGADFDLARARWREGQTFDEALWEMLETNFVRVAATDARAGDVLLMWFRDLAGNDEGPHHVAILSESPHDGEGGAMMHAIERSPNMAGAVIEQRLDALEWTRVDNVWRAKSMV